MSAEALTSAPGCDVVDTKKATARRESSEEESNGMLLRELETERIVVDIVIGANLSMLQLLVFVSLLMVAVGRRGRRPQVGSRRGFERSRSDPVPPS